MTEHLKIVVADHVMHITMARPEKKNALTQAMYVAFGEALTRAESDPSVRVVLIDSEGDSFTAGNDIADFAAIATGALKRERDADACLPGGAGARNEALCCRRHWVGCRRRRHDADAL